MDTREAGDRAARHAGKNPSLAEEIFTHDTDNYRSALRGGPEHTVFFLIRSFYDPRNEDIFYRGAGSLWMQAEQTEFENRHPWCCYSTD